MWGKKCIDCAEYDRCKDSFSSWIFFIVGLVAAIAIRAVTVLVHVNPIYSKAAWYIGVFGFFTFFIYKYKVNKSRARLIRQKNIIDKVNNEKELSGEDYKLLSGLLCALTSKKENINYIFIFGLSAVAILMAVYMDFIR